MLASVLYFPGRERPPGYDGTAIFPGGNRWPPLVQRWFDFLGMGQGNDRIKIPVTTVHHES